MDVDRATGAAKRRRERRLRSWWRHEAQSVQAAVVSALHHSRDVGPAKNEALRGQKKTTEIRRQSSRRTLAHGHRRPCLRGRGRSLLKSRCTGSFRVWGLSATVDGAPSLSLLGLADRAAEVVDSSSLRFLTAATLAARRKEEEEEKAEGRRRSARMCSRWCSNKLRMPWSRHGSCWRGARGSGGSGNFPRPLPCDVPVLMQLVFQQSFVEFPQARDARHHGRFGQDGLLHARSRLWQWHVFCWFGWVTMLLALRSLLASPSPGMLCIMAVMDQKDGALVVNHGSGMCLVGFPGVPAPRAVFFPPCRQAQDARHHGPGMNQREHSCGMVLVVQTAHNWIFHGCSSSLVVDFPVMVQRPIPMVLAVQQTIVIPLLQFFYKVIDVPGMQVVQVLPVVARCVQRQVPSTACSTSTRSSSSLSWHRGISPCSSCVSRPSRFHRCRTCAG